MIPLEYMPPLMFGGLVLFMLVGFPVAFSLMAVGLSFGALSIEMGFFNANFMQAIPQRIFGSVLANDLLLAIPFFTFMGAILEKCGLAEDMLDSMGQLFGPIRGGLGYSVIIVGFILGAITGTVAAQVIAMAMISLPVMMRYGYNIRYTTGVLAASGTITQLVPPSLVLVVLADQLKTQTAAANVGAMYLGAWGPSLVQILLFVIYTFVLSRVKPDYLPGIPKSARSLQGWALWKKCLQGIIPSAVLIFMVLGTMMLGIATPTESGAMGAVGAVILAVLRDKEFNSKDRLFYRLGLIGGGIAVVIGVFFFNEAQGSISKAMRVPLMLALLVLYVAIVWLVVRASRIESLRSLITQAYQTTMRITAMVVFILIGSTCFSVVFQGVNGGDWVEHLFTGLPGGWIGFLIIVNLFVFFLAFFLDFFEIAFIVVPMLAPVAEKILTPVLLDSFGGNTSAAATGALVWFGVMLCANMQTSFMHPPFGFALFYLRGVAPKEVKSSDIYWGAIPWVVLQLILVVLIMVWPGMVTGLLDHGKAQVVSKELTIQVTPPTNDAGEVVKPAVNAGASSAKPAEGGANPAQAPESKDDQPAPPKFELETQKK